MTDASAYDERVNEQFVAGFDAVRNAIASHIREGQRAGFVRPDLHPEETAGWITWMAERGMSKLVPSADDAGLRRLAKSMAAIVWYAIYDARGHNPSAGPVSSSRS
jgi:hypothetical protein